MAKFDRYMLSQLMMLFGFFGLVLVLVYWINRAVRLFDQLIADGQSAGVFIEFTILSLPTIIALSLPIAALAAAIYVTNRMSNDSELVAVLATGYSPYRIARPVVYFGLIVFVTMCALQHYLVPVSGAQLKERQADIAANATARLLTEGQFLEPVDGVTLYIRNITPDGELQDLFLADARTQGEQITYTASNAYLVKSADTTQLVMIDGLVQNLRTADQRLFTTSFKNFSYNIGDLIAPATRSRRRLGDIPTGTLWRADDVLRTELRRSPAQITAEIHTRTSEALLGAVAALIGFATLVSAGFSRFGVWRQIVGAIMIIVLVKGIEGMGINILRGNPALWGVSYLACASGVVISWALLFKATRPYLLKRSPQKAEVA